MHTQVFPIATLASVDRGWSRGHAHLRFDDVPLEAPGSLELGPLRLCGLETIDAGAGFALHEHRNVEIVTVVLRGVFCHEDTLGNTRSVGPGEVAVLSAGAGVSHAERATLDGPVVAIQLWFAPLRLDGVPRFEQRSVPDGSRRNRLVALASGRDAPGALPIGQDVDVLVSHLAGGASITHRRTSGRALYVLVATGRASIDGAPVDAGERAVIRGGDTIEIVALEETELLLLDLPVG